MESISARNLGEKNSQASSTWFTKWYLERIRDNPKWPIEAMMNIIDTNLRSSTKAGQVYWARSKPIEIIKDCYKEQYLQFFGFSVSYEAQIRGFKDGCRPVVGLDGWFLMGSARGTCQVFFAEMLTIKCFQLQWLW